MPLSKKPKALLVCIITLLLLAGCSRSEVNLHDSLTEEGEQLAEGLTFGIIFPMADPAYELITKHAEALAQMYNIRLLVAAPDEANLEQQIRIMESMIRQNVDGIAISPVDADALEPVINQAINNSIPVICFESDAPDSKRLSYIGADNYETGRKLGQSTSKLLNNKGMIIVGTGMSDMLSLKQRLEGLLDYINEETNIEVLQVKYNEGKKDTAIEKLEEMINHHPHFSAFLSLDSVSSSASILIWKATGMNRYVLSIGKTAESEAAIHNGQIHTIISQNEHKWGEAIIETLIKANQQATVSEFNDMGIEEITFNTQ